MIKLKILLADNDPDNLRNFNTYIKNNFQNMKVVANVKFLNDFKTQLRDTKPDLIIADIRFFGAQGYVMAREATEFFPNIRFIVYGTYNDNDYIQKIMEFGVIDYIYRPVKPTDMQRSLKRAEEIFMRIEADKVKQETVLDGYISNISLFKDKFLLNLVKGNLNNVFEITNSIKYFGINLEPDFTVMIVRIDHFKKLILAFDEKEKHLLVFKILDLINSKLDQNNLGIAFIDNLNTIAVILSNTVNLETNIKIATEIKNMIYVQTNNSVTIGMGRTYSELTDICISYKEAEASFRYRGTLGYKSVIPIEFVEPENDITYRYPLIKEEMLVYAAVTGQYEYSMELLNQIIKALEHSVKLPENLLPKIIMNIVISINRYASEQKLIIGNEFTTFFPSQDIFKITTVKEAYDYMEKSLNNFCTYVNKQREVANYNIIRTAKKYIEDNISSELTLNAVAFNSRTTPEFLAQHFKLVEKKSIYDYINFLKINRAKVIFDSTDKEEEEVSKMVGFSDLKKFRALFKKYEGVQPFEYKKQQH